jgi:hypothetical protein
MGNVQKRNVCINVPSSQTFRSYLAVLWRVYCHRGVWSMLAGYSDTNLPRVRLSATSNWSRRFMDAYSLFNTALTIVTTRITIIPLGTYNSSSWYIFSEWPMFAWVFSWLSFTCSRDGVPFQTDCCRAEQSRAEAYCRLTVVGAFSYWRDIS